MYFKRIIYIGEITHYNCGIHHITFTMTQYFLIIENNLYISNKLYLGAHISSVKLQPYEILTSENLK